MQSHARRRHRKTPRHSRAAPPRWAASLGCFAGREPGNFAVLAERYASGGPRVADPINAAPKCARRIRLSPGLARRRGTRGVRAASSATRPSNRFFRRRRLAAAKQAHRAAANCRRNFRRRAFGKLPGCGRHRVCRGTAEGHARTTSHHMPPAPRSHLPKPCGRAGARAPGKENHVRHDRVVPQVRSTGGCRRPLGCFAGHHATTCPSIGAARAISRGGDPGTTKKKISDPSPGLGLVQVGRSGFESWSREIFTDLGLDLTDSSGSKKFPCSEVSGGRRSRNTSQPEKFRRPMPERRPDQKVRRGTPRRAATYRRFPAPPFPQLLPARGRFPEFAVSQLLLRLVFGVFCTRCRVTARVGRPKVAGQRSSPTGDDAGRARAETIGRNRAEVPDTVGRGQRSSPTGGRCRSRQLSPPPPPPPLERREGDFGSRWWMTRGLGRYAETLRSSSLGGVGRANSGRATLQPVGLLRWPAPLASRFRVARSASEAALREKQPNCGGRHPLGCFVP